MQEVSTWSSLTWVLICSLIKFQILRFFVWHMEFAYRKKLYPLGLSDLVLHSSINDWCVVNGGDAMSARS